FRLAGQRSIIFELLHQLEWTAPDWIVLPAGNLGNTSAFGEALILAQRVGLIDRLPRLASVQAAGAAPFAAAFRDGFRSHPTVEPETIATAIRIGAPASWDRAVRAIRDTNGVALSVSDDEILAAKRAIDAAGIGCEPASAASLAGITAMIRSGEIDPRARVVAVLTGHVLKDPDIVMSNAPALMEIDPTLADVERVLAP
ncbi:MAG TPA: pyridoxal-phosphate dependent enzyme, partial [Gemmatimonadaceae bacterium]